MHSRTRHPYRIAAGILAATVIAVTSTIAPVYADDAASTPASSESADTADAAGSASTAASAHTRVTIHDPSIVESNGTYYSFGSHRAWAKSTDLEHWEPFDNNLSTDFEAVLGDVWEAWPKQSANPELAGNMWAPDVIYNPVMGKWLMYLSVNGGGVPFQKTVQVVLEADDIEGDWTLIGPVIYSGFSVVNAAQTDVYRVLGDHADLTRYASLDDTGINAIDANVHFDDDGNLWMALGSWFGGIWLVKLDPTTGLRDYTTTYETIPGVSDAYYGHKIAGGFGNSGEGASLVHDGDYWYLFLSYGGLTHNGGYQMREFRSTDITGPYVDHNGNPAVYGGKEADDATINRGLRIMSSAKLPGSPEIRTSQGGNSMLATEDGRIYTVFHTRFVRDSGNLEEHEVRVHEMLRTPDGWLVAVPYEKTGDVRTLAADATVEDVAGTFDVIIHDPTVYYRGGGESAEGVMHPVSLTLVTDGTVTGDAVGQWTFTDGVLSFDIESVVESNALHGHYDFAVAMQIDEEGVERLIATGIGGDVFSQAGSDVEPSAGRAAVWLMRTSEPSATHAMSPALWGAVAGGAVAVIALAVGGWFLTRHLTAKRRGATRE